MADKYKSASDNKYKSSKQELKKSKSRNTMKRMVFESKTPPLPSSCSVITEQLLKQKKSIDEKLSKHNNKKTGYKISSHKRIREIDLGSRSKDEQEIYEISEEMHLTKKMSPEHNSRTTHIDSEDEEHIIEQRRKQRKLLIAQLQSQKELKNVCPVITNDKLDDSDLTKKETISETNQNNTTKIYCCSIKDMFSEDDFHNSNKHDTQNNFDKEDCDDEEGYLKIIIGDSIDKYTISNVFGHGVFSNVVKAHETKSVGVARNDVAIKVIRNNELMYKTGLKEIAYLKQINKTDPMDKYHCIRLITHFIHKGHLCLVLECLHMDLRHVLKKYSRRHGFNLKAVMCYSRQLLIALRHLKKNGIIHADIKPDNIIVNEKKNILKLCDFGSAINRVNSEELTPYLVSRFYRAPEIILGLPYSYSIDMWSTACTIYEMATGRILFTGSSNNKMIKCFIDVKGKIPYRLLRKSKFKDQHFNYKNNFLLQTTDEFTGRNKVEEISIMNPSRDLYKEILKSYKSFTPHEESKIGHLKDILDKMLILDPNQRISVTDCLKHVFLQEELQR